MFAICKCWIAAHSEFFAKIEMSARFLVGKTSAVIPGFTGCLYGVDDSRVSRAAAQVARKSLLDGFAIARAALLQHRRRADNNPGDAEPALDAAFKYKRLTQHVPHLFRDTLKRHHIPTLYLFRFSQAGKNGAAINEDRAATACAFGGATVLWGNNAALLPKEFQHVHAWLVRNLYRLSI
jgi:hypothetical protein